MLVQNGRLTRSPFSVCMQCLYRWTVARYFPSIPGSDWKSCPDRMRRMPGWQWSGRFPIAKIIYIEPDVYEVDPDDGRAVRGEIPDVAER